MKKLKIVTYFILVVSTFILVISTIFYGFRNKNFFNDIIYRGETNRMPNWGRQAGYPPDLGGKSGLGSLISRIKFEYPYEVPKEWGERVMGVKTKMITNAKVIALTFDACGGKHGSGYDKRLIDYLIREKVPATLFINYRWIEANYETFMSLSKNHLFEIENHGYKHKPLSLNGKSAYGIRGTENITEVIEEITVNEHKIQEITGRQPKFFRSGTTYCDEVCVKIARELGTEVVSFNVLGDAGATFTKNQIINECKGAAPGSIIICHMNHPEKETASGIEAVVPELKRKGFSFVKLEEYKLE